MRAWAEKPVFLADRIDGSMHHRVLETSEGCGPLHRWSSRISQSEKLFLLKSWSGSFRLPSAAFCSNVAANRRESMMDKKTNAILIHHNDNVVTATESLLAGGIARYQKDREVVEIIVTEEIPKFHKIAVIDIPESNQVIKYGQVIGAAIKDIPKGSHVHDHNIVSPKSMSHGGRM
jgi:hypothetical protein